MSIEERLSGFWSGARAKLKRFWSDIKIIAKLQSVIFATMVFNLAYGLTTAIISTVQLSFFIGITGSYSLILGVVKFYALKRYARVKTLESEATKKSQATQNGIAENNTIESENTIIETIKAQNTINQPAKNRSAIKEIEKNCAKNIAICASVISFLHFSFAIVSTFFYDENPSNYTLWIIYFVAAAAFVKILLATINSIRTRKNHSQIIHHLRLTDVANALIALALTQRAILYFVADEYAKIASGIGGIFFSLCAALVCLTMFLKSHGRKKVLK
ncbi:MAG: hypothetical protein FWE84_00215 [Firmicutes bacterium]|nr:hypothetical protein [Bacillota bacterium]